MQLSLYGCIIIYMYIVTAKAIEVVTMSVLRPCIHECLPKLHLNVVGCI